jgi:magnesium transporter
MLKNYQIINGRVVESDDTASPIRVYINPDEETKKYLIYDFNIDEHTLISATDPDEQSRLEFEPEHVALIIKSPKNYSAEEEFAFKIGSVGFFLFKDFLIVICAEEVPLFEGKIFSKINSLIDVVLKFIFSVINHFTGHLKVIHMISDSMEDKISSSMENRYLLNLFELEKSLVYYLNGIQSNSMLIEKLKMNSAKIGLNQDQTEFLDDTTIENNQCYRQAEIYSNILASLMDARVSIVSNNLNILMKTLNIITIGIMVPTFVVSAFSMNVKIPFQQNQSAFLIILSLAVVSVAGFMVYWRLKKW